MTLLLYLTLRVPLGLTLPSFWDSLCINFLIMIFKQPLLLPLLHVVPPSCVVFGRGGDSRSSVASSGAAVVLICSAGEVKVVKRGHSLSSLVLSLTLSVPLGNAVGPKFNLRPLPPPRAPLQPHLPLPLPPTTSTAQKGQLLNPSLFLKHTVHVCMHGCTWTFTSQRAKPLC